MTSTIEKTSQEEPEAYGQCDLDKYWETNVLQRNEPSTKVGEVETTGRMRHSVQPERIF